MRERERTQNRDQGPTGSTMPAPHPSSILPPSLSFFFPAVKTASLLQRSPSLSVSKLWSHLSARPGLSSPYPSSFSDLVVLHSLLPSHSSNGPSMFPPQNLSTGSFLSLACSSPTCPYGSLPHPFQVFTQSHLLSEASVFTPPHTSYLPFLLFLLTSLTHYMFLHRMSAP